ncbi:MAG: hypothetical protein WCJ30_02540 [Deltaproteobacteria bacterium]
MGFTTPGDRGRAATSRARLSWCIAFASCLALRTSRAEAQTPGAATDGTVVRVDTTDLVIDVGSETGATDGATYRLYRPIEVRHPITHRLMRDRFPIGELRITSLGRVLSLARPTAAVARPPAVGDELASTSTPPATRVSAGRPGAATRSAPPAMEPARIGPAIAPPASSNVVPPMTSDERDALQTFLQSLGRLPEQRITLYGEFIARHPGSPLVATLRQDQRAMQTWVVQRARAEEAAAILAEDGSSSAPPAGPPGLHGERIVALDEGQSATVDLQITPGSNVTGALFNIRGGPGATFETSNAAIDTHGFIRVAVPDRYVHADGFDYFLEVVTHDGQHIPAFGDPENPVHVTVYPLPLPQQSTAGLTRIDLRSDFIDRNQLRGNDQYFILEGDFYQRLHFGEGLATASGSGSTAASADRSRT